MKTKNFILLFALVAFGFISCDNKDVIVSKDTEDQQFVLATHTMGLVDGVDSVQIIAAGHSLFEEFISSYNVLIDRNFGAEGVATLRNAGTSGDVAIYYYEDNKQALLVADEPENIVYAYVVETDTREFFNAFAVLIVDSADNEFDELDDESKQSWGKCMKGAMDRLFNDWDEDPVGTFVCWMMARACVVGGGLACAIQQLQLEAKADNNKEIQFITIALDTSKMIY